MTTQITAEALKKMLNSGAVTFAFEKKDGTIREAFGTRHLAMIPEKHWPKGNETNADTVNFYDIDKGAWRGVSFFAPVFI